MTEQQDIPAFFQLELNHFKQNYNWDCGLSCILMILSKENRQLFLNNFRKICDEEGFGESTWTIDLCYLLKRFNTKHKYLTTTIGINSNYDNHSYYDKILVIDEDRIKKKFQNSNTDGIVIEKRSATNKLLINHLIKYGPIILLTNAKLLSCDLCKTNKLTMEIRSCFPLSTKTGYNGHYIVLCGYNLNVRKYFYRNPLNKDRICMMSFDKLNEARTDDGTDEDVILIYNNNMNNLT